MAKKVKDPDRKVGLGRMLLWQSSSISVALTALVMGFLTVYCTDTLLLDPLIVGTVFMVSKIVDAITDMIVGVIIDRTNTKWGKGRPYEIFMLFLWLSTWLLFSTPTSFSDTAKYIWLATMYIFMNAICKTFLNGNNVVYLARAFKTKEQQVKVTAYGGFFTMGASLIFNIAFPIAMTKMATSAAGWSKLIGMLALPLTIVGLLRMLTIPEQYNNESDVKAAGEKLNLKEVAAVVAGNRQYIIFLIASLILPTITSMGTGVYYWKYIIGDTSMMGVTAAFTVLGLPLAFLMPRWSRKYGLGKMCQVGFGVAAIGYFAILFLGNNVIALIVLGMFTAIGVVPFTMMKNIFIVDLASYNEYRGLPRMEGTMGALMGLMEKAGGAVGGFILGFLLSMSGYDASLEVLPGSALMMIRLCMSVVPAIAFAVIVVLMRMYKVDKQLPEMKEKWEAQKAANQATNN